MASRTSRRPADPTRPVTGDATLHALYEVALAASRTRNPAEVARLALDLATRLMEVDGAAVFAWDPSSAMLQPIQETESSSHEVPVAPGQGAIGIAFETGQAVVVADYTTWEHSLPESAARGMVSAVAVPLITENQTVGAFGVWTYTLHDFGAEQVELLQVLAAQVAPALESARLVAEAEARSRIFEALQEVIQAASGGYHQVELADLVVARVASLLSGAGVGLFWFDPGDGMLALLGYTDDRPRDRSLRHRPGEGTVGIAFQERRSLVIEDYKGWKHSQPGAVERGVSSMAAVPIVIRDKPRGVIGLWTYEPRRFLAEEMQLLALFAGQVGPAIESARLMEQRQIQAVNFRILHDLAVEASGVLEPAVLARRTVDYARELMGCDGATLVLWDEEAGQFRVLADSDPDVTPRLIKPGGVLGSAYESRRPVVVEDYQAWVDALPEAVARGIKSTAAVPLLVGDRAVGVLSVRSYTSATFPPDDAQLLSLLAAQVAPALQTARLVQERESQARVFEALHDVAVAAGGVLEPAALAELAVQRAFVLLEIDSAGLYWWDPDREHLTVLADTEAGGGPKAKPLHAGQGVAGQAFKLERPVVVDDYQSWPHAVDIWRGAGYKSGLGVPLLVNDRPVGSIGVLSRKSRVFDAADTRLLSLLAAQVAPALEAARLHSDLVSSEERFRTLFETIACGVLVQGRAGEVLHCNQVAEQIFGLSLESMRGRPSPDLWRLYSEDGRELPSEGRPAMVALAQGRASRNHTLQVLRPDGERRWLQVDSVPLLNSRGAASQVVSTFVDITELKRTEAALRESEQRFRAVFDRSAVGIVRVGLDARIMETNPAFARMFGWEEGELSGRRVGEFMLREDRHLRLFAGLGTDNQDVVQLEIRFRNKQAGVVWTNVTASMVRDAAGEPLFVIAMVEDISARKDHEAALAHQAMHDSLTDLPNRVLLHDRLHQAIRVAGRAGTGVALMFMDLDRFKEVNDTFGHHCGDALLRQVAGRLMSRLRGSDTVARLGGDEFAVVLPGVADHLAAGSAAAKILEALEAPFAVEAEKLHVGGSIGIAIFPQHGDDAETLMRRADVAMYVAKRAGRGYAVYAAETDTHSARRLTLQNDLRGAIESGELRLHYQPKVSVADGKVQALEALVRWDHPEHGLMPPDQFIPMAESAGLIQHLGAWALEAAITQVKAWKGLGIELPVAVNLSMRNLQDIELPDVVAELLVRHGVPPHLLQVEITESTLMQEPERSLAVLSGLASMGVQFAIDDFGTGYSSLAYLRDLPASEIKIDRSFVRSMATNESDAVIVRSIIDLGHNLGLKVVAEGVEDAETLRLLAAGACDLAQGYLIGRPLPAAELLEILSARS